MDEYDISDAMMDVAIDKLHRIAETENELDTTGSVAQRKEQLPSKQSVDGSNPSGGVRYCWAFQPDSTCRQAFFSCGTTSGPFLAEIPGIRCKSGTKER